MDHVQSIVVEAGPASWTVRPWISGITVTDGADASARAVATAVSDQMLLWLWGRGGEGTTGGSGSVETA